MSIDNPTGTADLEAYNVAHDDNIGQVVWSSVRTPDTPVALSVVKAALDSVALGDFCPAERSPADVFRTSSTDLFKTPRQSADDGSTVKVTLKDVTTNPNEIVRRVVVEHRDAAQQRLFFGQTWDIRFNKEFHKIDLFPIEADADGRITPRDRDLDPRPGDDLVGQVRAAFAAHLHAVHPEGLRNLLNNVLRQAKGISVRDTGGVYFVPRACDTYVIGLKAFAKQIPGVSVSSLVMPNDPEHLELLDGAIDAATNADADELLRDLQTIQERAKENGTKVRTSTLNNLVARHSATKERLQTYSEILGDERTNARSRMEIIDALFAGVLASA